MTLTEKDTIQKQDHPIITLVRGQLYKFSIHAQHAPLSEKGTFRDDIVIFKMFTQNYIGVKICLPSIYFNKDYLDPSHEGNH